MNFGSKKENMNRFTLLKQHFKKVFHFKIPAKTIFGYCAIMLIYANYREIDGVDLILFFVKRGVSDS